MTEKLDQFDKEPQIAYFVTEKGSVYRYLKDGRTQRYKKLEDKNYEPQDAIVFVPNYERLKQLYTGNERAFISKFGENELQYNQVLLKFLYEDAKVYIVDGDTSEILDTNEEIKKARRVFLYFIDKKAKSKEPILQLPVSKIPKLGYQPYDTHVFYNSDGQRVRSRHLGHKIIKIEYK